MQLYLHCGLLMSGLAAATAITDAQQKSQELGQHNSNLATMNQAQTMTISDKQTDIVDKDSQG